MDMGKKKHTQLTPKKKHTEQTAKKKRTEEAPKKKHTEQTPQSEDGADVLVASLERLPDPDERYRQATQELERHQQAIERLSSVRADAAAQAYDSGDSVRSLAQRLGVSPSRVHQLIKEARARSANDPGPVVR
jgi:DNA-directed RNA polymerase specialized sigma24 family protein